MVWGETPDMTTSPALLPIGCRMFGVEGASPEEAEVEVPTPETGPEICTPPGCCRPPSCLDGGGAVLWSRLCDEGPSPSCSLQNHNESAAVLRVGVGSGLLFLLVSHKQVVSVEGAITSGPFAGKLWVPMTELVSPGESKC